MAVSLLADIHAIFIPWAYVGGHLIIDTMEILSFLGVVFFFGIAVYSIALDRAFLDYRYIFTAFLYFRYRFYNLVAAYSWIKELEERLKWEKREARIRACAPEVGIRGGGGIPHSLVLAVTIL